MVNMTTFYNASQYGGGMEGVLNWGNYYLEGWLSTAFLVMIWIVSSYVLSKSEWKMSSVITFSSLLTFLLSLIFSLFMEVNGYLIFFSSIAFIAALAFSIADNK